MTADPAHLANQRNFLEIWEQAVHDKWITNHKGLATKTGEFFTLGSHAIGGKIGGIKESL